MRPEQAWLLQEVELKERSIGKVAKEMGWTEVAGRLRLMRARRSLVRTFEKWEHEAKNSNEQKS
jgi:DNA-directed RNA polymerase specialized sigma24 family protein